MTLPDPVTRKRFLAPLCVLFFGMVPISLCVSVVLSFGGRRSGGGLAVGRVGGVRIEGVRLGGIGHGVGLEGGRQVDGAGLAHLVDVVPRLCGARLVAAATLLGHGL